MALEASLSHDMKRISLTVIAQGSILTEMEVSSLLEKMKEALSSMLNTKAQNPISIFNFTTNSYRDRYEAEAIVPVVSSHRIGSFAWTAEAQSIRKEISLLASVLEETISESTSFFELGLDSIDVIKLSSR